MGTESAVLRLRVIMVTTRAALRHAPADADQRRAIVQRGRELVDGLAAELDGVAPADALGEAHAELTALETSERD